MRPSAYSSDYSDIHPNEVIAWEEPEGHWHEIMDHIFKAPVNFNEVAQCDCLKVNLGLVGKADNIVFDLSKVDFIKPPAIIELVVAIERIYRAVKRPRIAIIPPTNTVVLEYLYRIGLPDLLRSVSLTWKIPPPPKFSIQMNPLMKIQRFRTSNEIENLAHEMQEKFRTQLSGLSTLFQPCHVIFSELADNVLFHASSGGGFVVAQQYNYPTGSMLEIALGDCGIGIKASLQKNPSLAPKVVTDIDAITMAMQDGISGTGQRSRGYGLGHIEDQVKGGAERILTMRSGQGYAIIRTLGESQFGRCAKLPGTLTHVVLPCE